MPIALVLAYLQMLPKLRAEAQCERVTFGYSAQVDVESMQDIEARFKDAIDNPTPQRRRAAAPSADALAAMGIGMITVPAEAVLNDG
jgi:hypothetical protein